MDRQGGVEGSPSSKSYLVVTATRVDLGRDGGIIDSLGPSIKLMLATTTPALHRISKTRSGKLSRPKLTGVAAMPSRQQPELTSSVARCIDLAMMDAVEERATEAFPIRGERSSNSCRDR